MHSVLVGADAQLDLPVRCVEQGRWNGDTAQRLHRRRAPLGVRGATHGVRRPGEHSRHDRRVDQGDVWSRVAAYEQTYGLRAAIPRPLLDRLTGRSLPTRTAAGAGVLAEADDDLVSVRALDIGDGRTIHATALNVRHELVLAA